MEACPGPCLISQVAKKETLIYLQRTAVAYMTLEHDKWEFHIHNYGHRSLFPCYQTFKLELSINDIFKTLRIFFSFLRTLTLGVITPSLPSQACRHFCLM